MLGRADRLFYVRGGWGRMWEEDFHKVSASRSSLMHGDVLPSTAPPLKHEGHSQTKKARSNAQAITALVTLSPSPFPPSEHHPSPRHHSTLYSSPPIILPPPAKSFTGSSINARRSSVLIATQRKPSSTLYSSGNACDQKHVADQLPCATGATTRIVQFALLDAIPRELQ